MVLLAVSSLTFDGFKNNNFINTFKMASKVGFERVEFNCWYAETLTPLKMDYLRAECVRANIQPVALHVSAFGGNSEESLAMNTAHKIRAIEAAGELGCSRVVASAMADTMGNAENIKRELDILATVAEDKKVKICVENHCNSLMANIEDYRNIFKDIDSGYIGICLDGGHLEAEGVGILEFILEFSARINHVHLKENRVMGEKSFCKFGEGITDNAAMVQELKERGYTGFMSVELSPEIETAKEFSYAEFRRPLELFKKYEVEGEI